MLGISADEGTMSRRVSNEPQWLGDDNDPEAVGPVTSVAATRLKTIATTLELPVAAFMMSRSSVALPRVFASREDEAAEVLRLYFAVDDIATRTRYLELLRGLSAPEA